MIIGTLKRVRFLFKNQGFTILEMMVIVVIIGILVAIAIPNFGNVTGKSDKMAVRGDLTRAFSEIRADSAIAQSYMGVTNDVIKADGVTVVSKSINGLTLQKSLPDGSGTCLMTVTAGGDPTFSGDC